MPIWKNSFMDSVYYDGYEADENEPCEVRIDGDVIVVSYEDEEGVVNYKGKMKGHDHFELEAPERNGKASLHRFEGSRILEGFWIEGGERGFWRITLA